jgi:hypothetical protein
MSARGKGTSGTPGPGVGQLQVIEEGFPSIHVVTELVICTIRVFNAGTNMVLSMVAVTNVIGQTPPAFLARLEGMSGDVCVCPRQVDRPRSNPP